MEEIKRHHGFFRGVVQDNKDPLNQRRVRVVIPQVTGDEVTDWVWPVEPNGVHTYRPSIGQGVWVSYLNSDHEHPIWHGSFGKHQEQSKPLLLKPLLNSVSLTGLTTYLQIVTEPDGTQTVDVTGTLLTMAQTLQSYETRISSMESQLSTLHATLATRSSTSHTHGSNG